LLGKEARNDKREAHCNNRDFAFYKRKDAFDMIRDYGGIPQENVTKETDYLVVGYYRKNTLKSEKSNKRFLAERYISQGRKIRIIKEDEFSK